MVSANTMRELEKLGIGCDVNRLESYSKLINVAKSAGIELVDSDRLDKVQSILSEVKPNSKSLEQEYDFVVSPQAYDINFYSSRYRKILVGDRVDGTVLHDMIYSLDEVDGADIVFEVLGSIAVQIRVVYLCGKLVEASVVNNGNKNFDLTSVMKMYMSPEQKRFKDIDVVELSGVMMLTDTSCINPSRIGTTLDEILVETLISGEYIKGIEIEFDHIYSSSEIPLKENLKAIVSKSSGRYKELLTLRALGLRVPYYKAVAKVTGEKLLPAITKKVKEARDNGETGKYLKITVSDNEKAKLVKVMDGYKYGELFLKIDKI